MGLSQVYCRIPLISHLDHSHGSILEENPVISWSMWARLFRVGPWCLVDDLAIPSWSYIGRKYQRASAFLGPLLLANYPLVLLKIAKWKIAIHSWCTHYTWWFSVVMLNYQRVFFSGTDYVTWIIAFKRTWIFHCRALVCLEADDLPIDLAWWGAIPIF